MKQYIKEFKEFKKNILKKTKEEIFTEFYKIHFFNEIYNFFENAEMLYEKELVENISIEELYQYFIKNEYTSINTYEDTKELIESFKEHYKK